MTVLRCLLHPIPSSFAKSLLTLTSSRSSLQSRIPIALSSSCSSFSSNVSTHSSPFLSEIHDVLKGYLFGQKKVTEVAHLVWKLVVQKGDTVVDATCGNGNDTLVLAKLVIDDSFQGCVYGMDVQEDAIKITSSLLDQSLDPGQRKCVKLFSVCHSRMANVLPTNVRLVAFNLGYLPGGDKGIITQSATTLIALEAAKELLLPGGVISIVAYVGHPGGREEYDIVRRFASELPAERWACSHIEMLNKPMAPVLIILFKR
ncbi:unnamed protein product [Amaranthus hypochondriacus]